MKFFAFLVVAALFIGSIYHAEITDYFTDLSHESYNIGSGQSVLSSMQSVGKKSSSAFGRVSDAFGR